MVGIMKRNRFFGGSFLKDVKWRRVFWMVTIGALAGLLIILAKPVHSKSNSLALLACMGWGWMGLLVLVWKQKPARLGMLGLAVLPGLVLILPGRDPDVESLREDYVQRVLGFEGTPYFWGGESGRGIDCSGLPRRAYREALFHAGLTGFNGKLLRGALEQWWYDTSAKAMGEGYRGFTKPVGVRGTIREMDYDGLVPGDLAVTDNGVLDCLRRGGEMDPGGPWPGQSPQIGWTDWGEWLVQDPCDRV